MRRQDEGAFGNELMTPTIHPRSNSLSLITPEALGDLGYVTAAAAAAEPYGSFYPGFYPATGGGVVASRAPAPARHAAASAPPIDRLFTARYRVVGGRLRRIAAPRVAR